MLQAGDGVISGVDAENYPIPLNLTNEARGSRMFSQFSTDAFDWVSSEAITMNNHHYAVSMAVRVVVWTQKEREMGRIVVDCGK